MPREQSPAFQFYPTDFLSDPKVLAMNAAERGVYIVLLCHCWTNGSIPDEPQTLKRISLYDGHNWPAALARVRICFVPQDGRLIHKRIERERQKQADYREMKRRAGLASAEQRGNRLPNRPSTDTPTEVNPPSLSLSLSSYPRIEELAKEKESLTTTSKNGSLSHTQKNKAARLAAARAMDRPWQKEQRRGVHRQR